MLKVSHTRAMQCLIYPMCVLKDMDKEEHYKQTKAGSLKCCWLRLESKNWNVYSFLFFSVFRSTNRTHNWQIGCDARRSHTSHNRLETSWPERCGSLWRVLCPIFVYVRLLRTAISGRGGVGCWHHLLLAWLTWTVSPRFRTSRSQRPNLYK